MTLTDAIPLAATLAAAAAILLLPTQARSQSNCKPWVQLKAELATKFQEVEIGGGVINPKSLLVVLASPDGATWTVVARNTDGLACLMSVGKGWAQRPTPMKEGAPT